jgi:hypothetical protein
MILPFPINKPLIYGLTLVGALVAGYLVYNHITLQATKIDALQASVELYKASAQTNADLANHNATQYSDLQEKHSKTLNLLKELSEAKAKNVEEDIKQATEVSNYVDALDKESFEAKCFNMDVHINGVQ